MRTKIISLALAAAGLSAVLRADPPESMELNFEKINAVIKQAMDPVIAASGLVSQFTYVVNPEKTDIKNDQYVVDMEIVAKEPWSDENFAANLGLGMEFIQDQANSKLLMDYSMDVATDTLALIRHHAQRSRVCDAKSKVTGALRVALTEDCRIIPRLVSVQSFDELFEIFRDHIDAAKIAMASYHADLEKAATAVTSDLGRESLSAQIAEAGRYIKGAADVQLTRTIDGVAIVIPDFPVMGALEMSQTSIDFSPAKVRGSGRVSIHVPDSIYKAFKPELLNFMVDVERDEVHAKPLIQMETRFWLRLLEDHITSQND